MSIPKIMGTETEYGIYVGNDKDNPRKLFLIITKIIESCPYYFKNFSNSNIVINGGRFYQDHLHPEFSTPECLSPRDLVIWEKAGERIVEESRKIASSLLGVPIIIYKDSCDRKGSSFGAHENYLLSIKTFEELTELKGKVAQAWISFLVTRQIWAGAGKVSQSNGYQISQRADFIRKLVHADTTVDRAIINTRNNPYANPEKFRRLHVIVGDANMSEYAIWLKVGLSAFLLEILENGLIPEDLPILKCPLKSLRLISKDLSLKNTLDLIDGGQMTALEIQEWFLSWFSDWYNSFYISNNGHNHSLEKLLNEYHYIIATLKDDPMRLSNQLDCWIKLKILNDYMAKYGLSWNHWRIQAIDMLYHNIQKEKSAFYYLQERGKIKRLVTDEEIEKAILEPPTNTRAYFRSFCLRKFSEKIRSADWNCIEFKGPIIPPLDNFAVDDITPFWGSKNDCEKFKDISLKEFRKTLKTENNLRLRRIFYRERENFWH